MAATDKTHDKMNCFISNEYLLLFVYSCSCLLCTVPFPVFRRMCSFFCKITKLISKNREVIRGKWMGVKMELL